MERLVANLLGEYYIVIYSKRDLNHCIGFYNIEGNCVFLYNQKSRNSLLRHTSKALKSDDIEYTLHKLLNLPRKLKKRNY